MPTCSCQTQTGIYKNHWLLKIRMREWLIYYFTKPGMPSSTSNLHSEMLIAKQDGSACSSELDAKASFMVWLKWWCPNACCSEGGAQVLFPFSVLSESPGGFLWVPSHSTEKASPTRSSIQQSGECGRLAGSTERGSDHSCRPHLLQKAAATQLPHSIAHKPQEISCDELTGKTWHKLLTLLQAGKSCLCLALIFLSLSLRERQ